jgi:small-conductance mechanosensitive channel
MALGEFGVNLAPFIASAGIVGVALGFGAQSLVKDFLSGIFMLLEDQYGVGDIIDVGETSGVVEVVNLRTTRIRDINGTLWHVPNGEIRRVANQSQEWARAVLDIEVAYGTNLAEAMEVIKRVADEVWEEAPENATVLEEPEVWGIEAFGESSIAIRLVMKVEPAEQYATARLVRGRIKEAFEDAGIEIPFPQRTVWLQQAEPLPVGASSAGSGDYPHEDLLPDEVAVEGAS